MADPHRSLGTPLGNALHSGDPADVAARDGRIYFQYESSFLQRALAISPVNLPLRPGVAVSPHPDLFQGLHGVFNDSLADGWGWLLFDRAMRARIVARPVRASRPSRPCRC